jgi:hypothetical protein
MKTLSYLPLIGDVRGIMYVGDYLRVEESADVKGCVFFDCTFDSQTSYSRAVNKGGLCINTQIAIGSETFPFVYINAKNVMLLNVSSHGDYGILSGGAYVVFSDSEDTLDEYGLLTGWTTHSHQESNPMAVCGPYDAFSNKEELGDRTFVRISIDERYIPDISEAILNSESEEFGTLSRWNFDAENRLYPREDGTLYAGFLYTPPHVKGREYKSGMQRDVYVFAEDADEDEIETTADDITEVVQELFPNRTELLRELSEDYNICTLEDADYTLNKYLSSDEISLVMNKYLGIADNVRFRYYNESSLFSTIRNISTHSRGGKRVGMLLDKRLLILDFKSLHPSNPRLRFSNISKYVTS